MITAAILDAVLHAAFKLQPSTAPSPSPVAAATACVWWMRLGHVMHHAAASGIVIAAIALGWTFTGCSPFAEAAAVSDATDAGDEERRPSGAAATDAASRPCASVHLFCDDFDDGGDDPSTRWDGITLGAGPVALDPSDSVSAPRSLRVSLTSGTGSRMTTIEKRVATTKAHVTVGFDFRVETPSSQDFGAITFAAIALVPATGKASGLRERAPSRPARSRPPPR